MSADWDSTTDTWTVQTEVDGEPKTYRGRFLFFGTGYYNYDEPYRPDFPGIEEFAGEVVHPQHWPESLDYTGKKRGGDRQRRDGGQHDPVADREGRSCDDAAAFAELHAVDAADQSAVVHGIRKVLPLRVGQRRGPVVRQDRSRS